MPKMPAFTVKVKHERSMHDVEMDVSQPALNFKNAIYQKTGIPPERQKVMVKGGLLKDDTDLAKLRLGTGSMLMVIGTAGELPKAPTGPVTFLEDMTDSELAEATRSKVGFVNLGNTCYLNSTLQVLRAIPELQVALNQYTGRMGSADGDANLTASLRELYKALSETTDPFPPFAFLTLLRQIAPQFAEQAAGDKGGMGGYAQQDAEEAWARIVMALQSSLPGLQAPGQTGPSSERFVEQYLTGSMSVTRSTKEAPEETPSISHEAFTLLQCNISSTTNDMSSGIKDSLNQQLEKTSETLGRTAVYDEVRRIDRLPAYLASHFVRFYWRREIRKKTKIMRKVRFPFELDVYEFLSDELKEKVRQYRVRLIQISKERGERARVRRRAKASKEGAAGSDAAASTDPKEVASATTAGQEAPKPTDSMAVDTNEEPTSSTSATTSSTAGQVVTEEEEAKLREAEEAELASLIHPSIKADIGANPSGLYELAGIVTHKGANADGGHYISWVRKDDASSDSPSANAASSAAATKTLDDRAKGEEWYKFDDEKVSVVNRDKISALDGGGEDSTAYILLYRSKQM